MDQKNIVALVEWVADKILSSGAEECSVSHLNSGGLEIEFRNGKIETIKKSVSNNLSISIYKDGKYSSHSTSSFSKNDLNKFIERGIEMTSFLSVDKFRSLPNPKYYKGRENKDLEIFDIDFNSVSTENKVDILKNIEETIIEHNKDIVSAAVKYSDDQSEFTMLNSNGFLSTKKSTTFSAGAEITLKDKMNRLAEDYYYATVRKLSDMPKTNYIANKALEFTIRKSGQNKIKSGDYETIVENRVVGNLLRTLISPLSGKLLYMKKSYLEKSLNKKIGSEALNIFEDPFIKGGLGSRLFDGEGITSYPKTIVKNGVLNEFYIDSYYGKKLKMEPNSGSYSNLVIPGGIKSVDEIIKEIKKGIMITGFIGGNFNSTTGDYSFGITGILIEEGIFKKPVNEMNITGNSNDLWNHFIEAADDTFKFSRLLSPSLRFSSLQYSGS